MKFRKRIEPKTGIDLTAMIDVVFNLLIFFMVGTTIINTPLVKVDLPKSSSEESRNTESITITITKEGQYFLNRDKVSLKEMSQKIRDMAQKTGTDIPVIVRSDKNTAVEKLVDAMNLANSAGFAKVSIAVAEE